MNYFSIHYGKHLSNLDIYCSFSGGYNALVLYHPDSEPTLLDVFVAGSIVFLELVKA